VSRSGHKYAFLINPVSGSGRGLRIQAQLPLLLEAAGLEPSDWHIETTVRDGVAAQVSRLFETYDRVIIAGGDGTIGQALDGALDCGHPDRAVGFFPLGTGNDMALELQVLRTFRWKGAQGLMQAFLDDRTVELDLWDVNGTNIMANYLSVGLDASVAMRFARYRQQHPNRSVLWNKLFYFMAGFANLRTYLKDFEVHLGNAGEASTNFAGARSVLILNISSYAAGTLRSPGTRPDDGELSIVPIPSFLSYVGLVPGTLFAPLARASARALLPIWRTRSVHARWQGEIPLQIDGEPRPELGKAGHLDITHKGKIKVLLGTRTPWFARHH
jgi:diacylglycerol kinase family enzyme